MDDTDTAAATADVIEAAFGRRWAVWLSDTGRWWAARTRALTNEEINAGCAPYIRAETPDELTARLHQQDKLRARPASDAGPAQPVPGTGPPPDSDITLDDLRRIYATRWEIAPITGGYRATPRAIEGQEMIPRYGRTAAELAESIRLAEGTS